MSLIGTFACLEKLIPPRKTSFKTIPMAFEKSLEVPSASRQTSAYHSKDFRAFGLVGESAKHV